MQNKANWKIVPMTITNVLTTDYNSWTLGVRGKNKANSNPILCYLSSTKKFAAVETNPICFEREIS